nr:zinc finger, CCHC-type [Tanacetum cinerariifolium]
MRTTWHLFDPTPSGWERTRLLLFQFSLRDQVSNWLERLLTRSITTWEDLTTRFLAHFFPPRRTAKLHNDILMFRQHHGESLLEAWTRFKDLLQKVPYHGIDRYFYTSKTPDRRLLELEDEINFLLKGSRLTPRPSSTHIPQAYAEAVYLNPLPQNQNEPSKHNPFIFRKRTGPNPQPQALGITFEARVWDYMAAHTERMKRFENAIFKQREEINDRITKTFGLLKELTTKRTPEKVLIREEAKFPITKNVNCISLARGEKERSDKIDVATGNDIEKPTITETGMQVNEAKKKNEAGNEEMIEVPSSQPVEYYLKHSINKKLIEGLVDNRRLSLASHSYIYPLGIAEDILVEVVEHVYPVDFMILDIKEDEKRPFILETPFLTTAKAVIKFDKGTITLRSGNSKISFHRILESLRKIERGVKNDIDPIAPNTTINRLVLEWEEKIKLHLERELKFDQRKSKNFKSKHHALVKVKGEMNDEGEVTSTIQTLPAQSPIKPQSKWINLMHGEQSPNTLKFQQQRKQSKPYEAYRQSHNARPKSALENPLKITTGLTKEKTLEFKTKKPEESSLNWKPLRNDWAATTSKPSEATTEYQEAIQATEEIKSPAVGFAKTSDYKGELPTQEDQIRGYRTMTRGIFMIRLHAPHRRSVGTNALVVLRDTRWEDSQEIIGIIEVDLSTGTQLVYMFPNMVLSIDDFNNHVEVSIQTHGYDTRQGGESNLLVIMAMIVIPGERRNVKELEGMSWNLKNLLNKPQTPQPARYSVDQHDREILVYPPTRQNPQPTYKPDYQFGYPQGRGNAFNRGYDEYHNSQWTLPPAWIELGVMLVLPAGPGLWSNVISRWESITINRLNSQTWSNNKAKLAFVENLLGESKKLMWQQWRTTYPSAYSALQTIVDDPQNITSQVRQLIIMEDPYRGSTNEQDRAYRDLDRITCEETKNLWSFLEDFWQLAIKSRKLYFPSTTKKFFAKLPPSLSKKIEESFKAKHPGLSAGVLPAIKFTHTFVSEISKQGNIARSDIYQELDLDDNWDIVSADFDDSSVYSISEGEDDVQQNISIMVQDTLFEEATFMTIEGINESDDEQSIKEDYDDQNSHHAFMFHPGPPTKIADMV